MFVVKRWSRIGLLFLVGSCFGAYAQDPVYVTTGTAYEPNTTRVIYREAYTALNEQGEVKVDYFTPEGKKFASKTLWFTGEPYQPAFELKDFRNNETVSAKFENARLILRFQDRSGPRGTTIFEHAGMVIDAGYDSFIQLNWDKLVRGKEVSFEYALPKRLTSVKLRAEKVDPKTSPAYDKVIGQSWIYFKLQPVKKWVSIFSDPIHLAYDPNGKYLMRFYGRSSLDDARGIPQAVRIEYEYF